MRALLPLLLLAACTPTDDDDAPESQARGGLGEDGPVVLDDGTVVFRDVTDGPGMLGPGAPVEPFTEDELNQHCAYLPGGDGDFDHHNLVVPYRGYLTLPWAPEFGIIGGVSFFDMSDPCAPVKIGEGTSNLMRETHAMGFVQIEDGPHAGDWAFTNGLEVGLSGIQTWDVSDVENPVAVANLGLEGSIYPDSYNLVTLSLFVQYPWLYAASAGQGVFVVDITDPTAPETVAHYRFEQGMKAGGVFALGDVLFVSSAQERTAALLDVSNPADPVPFLGGAFDITDGQGVAWEAYHANLAGHLALFARKEGSGGPIVYDLSDPTDPTWAGELPLPGSGGYVFYDEGFLFTGDSSIAHIVDATDLGAMEEVLTLDLPGDLDTNTPWGNLAILAVDDLKDEGTPGQSTAVVPWSTEPDTTPIEVMHTRPIDGATGVATTSPIGIGFEEMVEPGSVFPGSLRMFDAEGRPVPGWTSAQEAVASFVPKAELKPGQTYTVEVKAGGVTDIHGHALAETHTFSFTTAE